MQCFTELSRRALLACGIAVATISLCSGPAVAQGVIKEAPALAAKVARNELPPVAQRIPQDQRVVKPRKEIGRYGGTRRATMLGASDHWWLIKTVASLHLA